MRSQLKTDQKCWVSGNVLRSKSFIWTFWRRYSSPFPCTSAGPSSLWQFRRPHLYRLAQSLEQRSSLWAPARSLGVLAGLVLDGKVPSRSPGRFQGPCRRGATSRPISKMRQKPVIGNWHSVLYWNDSPLINFNIVVSSKPIIGKLNEVYNVLGMDTAKRLVPHLLTDLGCKTWDVTCIAEQ